MKMCKVASPVDTNLILTTHYHIIPCDDIKTKTKNKKQKKTKNKKQEKEKTNLILEKKDFNRRE